LKAKAILDFLEHRHFPSIDPASFTPEFIKKMKAQLPTPD
jgi:hypothetical protein